MIGRKYEAVPMTVAMMTASSMVSTRMLIAAEAITIATIRVRLMVRISPMVAPGLMNRWYMSLDKHDAPDVANVSAQDIEAAAKPIAIAAISAGDDANVSRMNVRYNCSATCGSGGTSYSECIPIAARKHAPNTTATSTEPINIPDRADFTSLAAHTRCHGSCSVTQPGSMAICMIKTPTIPPSANRFQKPGSIAPNRSDTDTSCPCAGVKSASAPIIIARAARNMNWTVSVQMTALRPPSVT